MPKPKLKTTGTAFEARVREVCQTYLAQGRAKLEKVDPPTVKTSFRVIYKDNPFLDFVGSWIERGSRIIHIEAKSNSKRRLPISTQKDGVSTEQIANLIAWENAGAAVGILWEHNGEVRFVTLAQMAAAKAEDDKSVAWEMAYRIPSGPGVDFDFLAVLHVLYPCNAPLFQAKMQFTEPDSEEWPEDPKTTAPPKTARLQPRFSKKPLSRSSPGQPPSAAEKQIS